MSAQEQRMDHDLEARAVEVTMDLAHAHGFDADATLQAAIVETLISFAHAEGDALLRSVLTADDAAVLARRARVRRGSCPEEETMRAGQALGADRAIKTSAQRCLLGLRQWDERAERAQLMATGEDAHVSADEGRDWSALIGQSVCITTRGETVCGVVTQVVRGERVDGRPEACFDWGMAIALDETSVVSPFAERGAQAVKAGIL